MKVSNRNFYQVMEGAEQRMQLHYKVFAAELGWLRAHLGLVLRVHPRASLRAAVACAFGKAVWKAPLLWRYHRYGFTNSTFASLAVWSVSSWFFLPWFLWVQTRWWLCVCLLWYVQSLALLPTQSLNVSSHHPSYHSDPSFQTHYSHETYAGVENELWKRGQANTPESQECFPCRLCEFGLMSGLICCCSQKCFLLLWPPTRFWTPEGTVRGSAIRHQPLGLLRSMCCHKCTLAWMRGFCSIPFYLEGQISVHFSGNFWDLLLVLTIKRRVGCADTNSCEYPVVPRTKGTWQGMTGLAPKRLQLK